MRDLATLRKEASSSAYEKVLLWNMEPTKGDSSHCFLQLLSVYLLIQCFNKPPTWWQLLEDWVHLLFVHLFLFLH